jgi:hypothetical protein
LRGDESSDIPHSTRLAESRSGFRPDSERNPATDRPALDPLQDSARKPIKIVMVKGG